MRIVRPLLLAGAVVALSAFAAAAERALVVTDLHLRAGPSTSTPSLGVIPGGSTIDAAYCDQGGWCEAYAFGRRGFVSATYLDFGRPYRPRVYAAPPPPPVVYAPPRWGWGW